MPFIERVIPKEWISPVAIQHAVETHMNEANNNSNSSSSSSTSSSQSTEQQKLVQTSNNITANKSESVSSEQSINSNNSIWSAIFNSLDKLDQNESITNRNKM